MTDWMRKPLHGNYNNRPSVCLRHWLRKRRHNSTDFVFVIPANAELSVKKAARAAKVKDLEMLPLKKLLPLTGYVHGGCSPVGMKKNFAVFIDETAMLFDTFFISGGKIGLTLEMNAEALAKAIGAEFADLTL